MNSTVLQERLEEFKKGTINLLISTSVSEEGIDVAACNCVVRFDRVETPVSVIQSRGRARQVSFLLRLFPFQLSAQVLIVFHVAGEQHVCRSLQGNQCQPSGSQHYLRQSGPAVYRNRFFGTSQLALLSL
jgi:hypothetical protein